MCPFLDLAIRGIGWSRQRSVCRSSSKEHRSPLQRKQGEPHGSTTQVQRTENFLAPLGILTQTVQPAQQFGRIKANFESVDGNKRPGLEHYMNISVQRITAQRNT